MKSLVRPMRTCHHWRNHMLIMRVARRWKLTYSKTLGSSKANEDMPRLVSAFPFSLQIWFGFWLPLKHREKQERDCFKGKQMMCNNLYGHLSHMVDVFLNCFGSSSLRDVQDGDTGGSIHFKDFVVRMMWRSTDDLVVSGASTNIAFCFINGPINCLF